VEGEPVFKHILVPMDGSHLAESVLPVVAKLSQTLGSTVTLVHVIEEGAPADIHGEHHLKEEAEAFEYLKDVAVRAFPGGTKIDRHVHSEKVKNVAVSIIEHAGEFAPDMIVLCSHGKGGWRDIMVGTIAQQVIGLGRIPVLLIQPAAGKNEDYPLSPILVALDGEPDHEAGLLPTAAYLAKEMASSLKLITVVPTLATLSGERGAAGKMLPGTAAAILEIREKTAAEHLQALANLLERQGLRVTCSVGRGDPAQMIRAAAESSQTGLIMMGTHGKAGISAFWARSVAARVITNTNIPLLLLPADRPT
jgi:nucleotide-binding universal stress UspA family protein